MFYFSNNTVKESNLDVNFFLFHCKETKIWNKYIFIFAQAFKLIGSLSGAGHKWSEEN